MAFLGQFDRSSTVRKVEDSATHARSVTREIGHLVDFGALCFTTFLHGISSFSSDLRRRFDEFELSSYRRCEFRWILVQGYGLLKNIVAILRENLDSRLPILDILLTLSDFTPQFRKLVVDIGGHDIISCTLLLRVKRVVLARDGCSK